MKALQSLVLGLGLIATPVLSAERSPSAEPCKLCDGEAAAWFEAPVARYGHNVLGDTPEWSVLVFDHENGLSRFELAENRVFEDIAPRLADLSGDGVAEAIVVESDNRLGAQLAVYGPEGKIAETPFIGRAFRWLAPAGIADFNGDGATDVAYVETPHLGKTLRIWTMRGDRLEEMGRVVGVTNHRIGEPFISSAVRECGNTPQLYLASADWTAVVAVRFVNGALLAEEVSRWKGPDALGELAATC